MQLIKRSRGILAATVLGVALAALALMPGNFSTALAQTAGPPPPDATSNSNTNTNDATLPITNDGRTSTDTSLGVNGGAQQDGGVSLNIPKDTTIRDDTGRNVNQLSLQSQDVSNSNLNAGPGTRPTLQVSITGNQQSGQGGQGGSLTLSQRARFLVNVPQRTLNGGGGLGQVRGFTVVRTDLRDAGITRDLRRASEPTVLSGTRGAIARFAVEQTEDLPLVKLAPVIRASQPMIFTVNLTSADLAAAGGDISRFKLAYVDGAGNDVFLTPVATRGGDTLDFAVRDINMAYFTWIDDPLPGQAAAAVTPRPANTGTGLFADAPTRSMLPLAAAILGIGVLAGAGVGLARRQR